MGPVEISSAMVHLARARGGEQGQTLGATAELRIRRVLAPLRRTKPGPRR